MKTLLLFIFLFTLLVPVSFAQEDDNLNPSPWRNEVTYGDQVASKAGFGAKNLIFGFTELVQEPIEQKNPVGIVQGLGNAVMDTVGGLLHLITAPLTTVDVPLPENGTNLF